MSLPDRTLTFVRALAAIGIAALAAGCFQPMYGERLSGGPANGESAMALALASVDVPEIDTPQGQRISRISVELRNDLIFALTGGRGTTSPTHRLKVILNGSGIPVIVDINSGRTEIFNYRLTATYVLTDLATGRPVVRGSATGEVSYNIPGSQQRFVGERGLRDAENRAALTVSESIRNRLASYFTAGT